MPEFCTCGAQLPPDARFCHKCGKPQREEPMVEREEVLAVPLPPPVAAAAPLPLNFQNPTALRVGLLAAGLLCVVMMIPGINYAAVIWWLAAGYFSVWIYRRRTGQRLNVRGGARMGWITGVLSCAILTLLFAFFMLAIRQMGGLAALKDSLKDFSFQQGSVDEALRILQDPSKMLRSLIATFILLTLTCTAGGALGAKILGKD
ncbi:MAG: zinc ribbon domain-containing protein [Acidobacteriia bacterium]|nr:zinc ribbon domain-containing protein [Terriglobia bacterium]